MCSEVREVQWPLTPKTFLRYSVRTLRASLSLSAHGGWFTGKSCGFQMMVDIQAWNILSCSQSCMHALVHIC